MHARIEHLLSLRDGEPVASDVREHVAHCRACAAALRDATDIRGRLRAMGGVDPAPYSWDAVRTAIDRRAVQASRRVRASRIAVAASLGVIAVALAWRAGDDFAAPPAAAARQAPLAAEEAVAMDRVLKLQTQSQALEDVLFAFGEAPAVQRAGSAVPIETLEARVQWIDHQLSSADGLEARAAERLWRERVALMNSLVQLRYVEAQRIDI